MYYSTKRQQFLIDQGYSFKVITDLPPPKAGPELSFYSLGDQNELLKEGLCIPVAGDLVILSRSGFFHLGQYFLLPYNHVHHWALTVVNPEAQVVYHMDPLKRRLGSDEWLEVVDNGIKLYKDKAKKISKKKIPWENMAGVPLQHGATDCGLFVMRFMKEICEDKELNFANKWARRGNLAYSTSDIVEIKTDWAKFFMKHHAS
ncbi:hypothetical protein POM88_004706 [Heracleum sosnowskyi]|uniref:Ubiquitin-like protease family profile domain-containing protein n=2 Tax=Heracleum sosnowskyi TaxID=360622 RepID=A0AAD8JM15_9APIA|nr:hypothetical protein POM88_004706 [Heracleum sosnowskyi]